MVFVDNLDIIKGRFDQNYLDHNFCEYNYKDYENHFKCEKCGIVIWYLLDHTFYYPNEPQKKL